MQVVDLVCHVGDVFHCVANLTPYGLLMSTITCHEQRLANFFFEISCYTYEFDNI